MLLKPFLTGSDPASNRVYYIDTHTGQSHWEIPATVAQPLGPAGERPPPAFHSDNVVPTQNSGDMGDSEATDRGFLSDMAMNAMKSRMSGGKSPPPGPMDKVGNILSSFLGGGNNQPPPQPNKTSGGVGGIVSSFLSGGQNTNQSSQNTSNTTQQGTPDFGGMISSLLGGGNQNTNQSTPNQTTSQQGTTDYAGMISSFLGGENQNANHQSTDTSTPQQAGGIDYVGKISSFLGGGNQSSNNSKPPQGTTNYGSQISSFLSGGNQTNHQSTPQHSAQEADLSNLPSTGELFSSLFGGGSAAATSAAASRPPAATPPAANKPNKYGSSDLGGKLSGALGGVAASFSGKKQDEEKPRKHGNHIGNQEPEYAVPTGVLPGSFPLDTNAQHGQTRYDWQPQGSQPGYANAPPSGNPYEYGYSGGQQNAPAQHQYGQPQPPQVYPVPPSQGQAYGQANQAPYGQAPGQPQHGFNQAPPNRPPYAQAPGNQPGYAPPPSQQPYGQVLPQQYESYGQGP